MSIVTCDGKVLDSICLNALCALGYGPAVAERGHMGKEDTGMAIRQLTDLRQQIAKELPQRPKTKKRYQMLLESAGNPDWGQYAPISEPLWVAGDTVRTMRKAAEAYRTKWELGGGNWTMPEVLEGDKVVGHFSYNLRFWEGKFDSKNWEKAKEIMIEEGK